MSTVTLTPIQRLTLETVRDHPRIASAWLARILWPHRFDGHRVTHNGRSARPEFGLQMKAGQIQSALERRGLLHFPGWMNAERGRTYVITPAGLAALEASP